VIECDGDFDRLIEKLDRCGREACDLAFRGGTTVEGEGETGSYLAGREDVKPSPISPFYRKPRNLYNTGQSICAGRGCMRACMVGLEARGVLENRFHQPFRRRKPWTVDWSVEPEDVSAQAQEQMRGTD